MKALEQQQLTHSILQSPYLWLKSPSQVSYKQGPLSCSCLYFVSLKRLRIFKLRDFKCNFEYTVCDFSFTPGVVLHPWSVDHRPMGSDLQASGDQRQVRNAIFILTLEKMRADYIFFKNHYIFFINISSFLAIILDKVNDFGMFFIPIWPYKHTVF